MNFESNSIEWLPELVEFSGDWSTYFEVIYTLFKRDFINNNPYYEGSRVVCKKHPMIQGKEATFWHLITSGHEEDDRKPDLRRCERIEWPRKVIENFKDDRVLAWENLRRGERRILLWLQQSDYLVVLAIRKGYVLLWTAYTVDRHHNKRKLMKEYQEYIKANAAN